MTKPKLLFILHLPPPIHGPAIVGEYIKNSEVINEAFDIEYINLQTSRNLSHIGKGVLTKLSIFINLYWQVLKALLKNRYDYCYLTINAHGPAFYKEIIVVVLLKLFGLKTIYYYHMKGVKRFQDQWLPDKLYRFQFWKARTIQLSPLVYFDIAKYVPRDKVFFCIEGIPDFTRKNVDKLIELRLEKNTPELLFLSNMMKAKGVEVLLEACKLLHLKGINFKMTFIGGIVDIRENDFNAFVDEHDLKDKVEYVGPKYGSDKHSYFEQVDLFIHPTFNDVQPLTILEAMQYGLPVISTDEGTIADMVEDGVSGYIVPKADPNTLANRIEHLIKSKALRQEMSRAARKRYEQRFTLEKFEQNFIKAMKQAMTDFEQEKKIDPEKKVEIPVG